MRSNGLRLLSYLASTFIIFASIEASAQVAPPAYAAAVGYTKNTFSTNFTKDTVDSRNTGKTKFSWYMWNLYGTRANPAALQFNTADSSVTLNGDTTGPNGELITATNITGSPVGTAFGGGAYIEGVFKFNPADVQRMKSKGWPSFWSLSLDSSVIQDGYDHWPSAPVGYVHAIEADFFEYLMQPYGGPVNAYGSALHDWYGIQNVTCKPGLCQVAAPFTKSLVPANTDFTQYHRYGFLWVPATNTTTGYVQFYFDGQPVGLKYSWSRYIAQTAPPTNQPWAFGKLDQQRLVLILGTGVGEPMTVQSVNVWQASAAQNFSN